MKKKKTFAGRITRNLLVWLVVIMVGLSFFVFHFVDSATRRFYIENYHNKTLITMEYTRRVISDVYVAVTNNIYYLEQNLDNPDGHTQVMERIVRNGTRVRSCGISFIGDYYYPRKGHRFCPYAWRSPVNLEKIETVELGDSALDYLNAEWFHSVTDTDSAHWSEPFYDGSNGTIPLTAYMAPIHDKDGKVIAVLGADVSLDWLTDKLNETDSVINDNSSFVTNVLDLKSSSFIINHDGTFITHPEADRILKDNFFNHIEGLENYEAKDFIAEMRAGAMSEGESEKKIVFDGHESYVFFTPVKYTQWMLVTVVPWQSIDILGYINSLVVLVFILLAILVIIVMCRFYIKRDVEPLKKLTHAADEMAKGNFKTTLPTSDSNDEIQQLITSFDEMQYSLKCQFDDLKNHAGAKDKH